MTYPPYPRYKPSGIQWLGDVPEHWEAGCLRRFAQMRTGHTPSRSEPEYWDDCDIPWFTLADVWQLREGRKYLGETKERISQIGLQNSSAELLPAGTVVFSRTASVGFSGIMPIPMATTQDFWNWVPGAKLLPEYLLFVFRSLRQEFEKLTMGSTHKTIYQPDAARLAVSVPPLPEQRAIIGFLEAQTAKLDTLVAKKRALIERLQEKRAALISATVTRGLPPEAARAAGLDPHPRLKPSGIDWLGDMPEHWWIKRLKHAVTTVEQGWSPDCQSRPPATDEWGVVKAGCCNGGLFNPDESKALPPSLDPPRELMIKPGDVLMSRASGSDELIGSTAWVPAGTRAGLLLSDKTYRLRCKPGVVQPQFLAHVLQSSVGRRQIGAVISGAAGLAKNITQVDVRGFTIPLPTLSEQVAIVDYLDRGMARIDQIVVKVEAAIDRLQEYRAALITAAVTGKIDLRAAAV